MLRSFISEGDNILDIGAHIGTFSIPFTIFNKKKGTVFSFEANPDNYELLVRNIQENQLDQLIIPINAVVSMEGNTEFSMFLPDSGNSGMYYFSPNSSKSDKSVPSININNWYNSLDKSINIQLIKIDVEGAELSVLCSCHQIIEKYKPILYIEISKTALERFNSTIKDIEEMLDSF